MGLHVRRLEGEGEWGWRQKHSLITDLFSKILPRCHLCSLLASWPGPLFPIVEYAVISNRTASLASVLLASFTLCWVSDISWYSAYTCLCSISPLYELVIPPYHPDKSVSSATSSFWWLEPDLFLCLWDGCGGMGWEQMGRWGKNAKHWGKVLLVVLPAEDGLGFIYTTATVNILGDWWNLVA